MFKISPIQDAETQALYAEKCGTKSKEGFFSYAMTDVETGALMGLSQFEILDNQGYISDLLPVLGECDYEAMFILGRATMNFIDMCGVHTARADVSTGEERLLHAIGFRKTDDGDYFCDMTGLFSGHCDGEAIELT